MMSALLSVNECAGLLQTAPRTMRARAAAGVYLAKKVTANGGEQYAISVESLPQEAQARYWAGAVKKQSPSERRAYLESLNLEEQTAQAVARAAGVKRRGDRNEPLPLTPTEWREKRERFDAMPRTMKDEAARRVRALTMLRSLISAGGSRMEHFGAVATEFGESSSTIRRWHKATRNQEQADWYLFLAPDYKCKGLAAEVPAPAWGYILARWLVQSKPSLAAVYQRAKLEAARNGWGALPSLKTIRRRIDREVPFTMQTLKREGVEALAQLYPAQRRAYDCEVHAIWESDGRKADLFVRFPDGEVRRPILMVWRDVRTRFPLGWAIGKTENVLLVRASLRDAMLRSGVVPREVLIDSGRAYASKEMTGGQPNRYRFKVNEDDLIGVTTLLQISVVWATPQHGQSKPIESFWRTISETEKRAEFCGAYCGNRPDAKPEEFDPKKAIPVADYAAAVAEDIEAFKERPHRGEGMDGCSPVEMYTREMASAIVRKPTAMQLHLCLQAAEKKMLDRDHGVTILGNRYWHGALAALPSRGPYTVRFDAEDATVPVAVYDGERLICEAPMYAKTGFRDQEAAKTHNRARNAFKKAAKVQAKALVAQAEAASWNPPPSAAPVSAQPAAAAAMPAPKLAELVTLKRQEPLKAGAPRPAEPEAGEEQSAWLRKLGEGTRRARAIEEEEPWRRQLAAGGR